jgi:hypothetical protein
MRKLTPFFLYILIMLLVACENEQPTVTPESTLTTTVTSTAVATPSPTVLQVTETPNPTDIPDAYPVPATATAYPGSDWAAYPYPEPTAVIEDAPSFEVFSPSEWLYFPIIDAGPPCPSKHGLAWGLRYEMRHVPSELCTGTVQYWTSKPISHYRGNYDPVIWCVYNTPRENECISCSTLAAALHWLGANYSGRLHVGNEPDVATQCADELLEIGESLPSDERHPDLIFARFVYEVIEAFPQAQIYISHTNATHFDQPSDYNGYSTVGMLEAYRELYGDYPDVAGVGAHYEISGRSVEYSVDYIADKLDDMGLDHYQLAWTEFQVCGGYDRMWEVLDRLNASGRVDVWFYYTNHRTLVSTANCTLYSWVDDIYMGDYFMNERGQAYRDWGLAHRGE